MALLLIPLGATVSLILAVYGWRMSRSTGLETVEATLTNMDLSDFLQNFFLFLRQP